MVTINVKTKNHLKIRTGKIVNTIYTNKEEFIHTKELISSRKVLDDTKYNIFIMHMNYLM